MTRVAIGAMCVAVLITAFQRRSKRRALGAFALEQIEHLFDAIQSMFSSGLAMLCSRTEPRRILPRPTMRNSPGTKGAGP